MVYGGSDPDPDPTSDNHPAQIYQDNDIQVEYHPKSGCSMDTFKFDKYRQPLPHSNATLEPEPWAPFRTREDFEFAELMLDTGVTKKQAKALIKLFHKCIKGGGNFTISKYKDMEDTLKLASNQLAKVQQIVLPFSYLANQDFKFQKRTITPKYKAESREFEVWVRPISEWAEEMLQDEDLINHFVWDAERVSNFDSGSGSWVRVVDEPWTADRFWEIQVGLI